MTLAQAVQSSMTVLQIYINLFSVVRMIRVD